MLLDIHTFDKPRVLNNLSQTKMVEIFLVIFLQLKKATMFDFLVRGEEMFCTLLIKLKKIK